MEKLIQIILVVAMGYICQIMMQALGQKQIGSVIKICIWAIALFLFVGMLSDCLAWIQNFIDGYKPN